MRYEKLIDTLVDRGIYFIHIPVGLMAMFGVIFFTNYYAVNIAQLPSYFGTLLKIMSYLIITFTLLINYRFLKPYLLNVTHKRNKNVN